VTTTIKEMAVSGKLVDLRAEQKLLACILKEQDAWMRLPEGFSPDVLTSSLNRALFFVIDSLYAKGAQPDPIAISEGLPSDVQGELEAVGGWGFLETLRDLPMDSKNVEFVAKDLIELRTRRRIESAGGQIAGMAGDSEPVNKIIENIEVVINDIEGKSDLEVTPIGQNAMEFVQEKMAHPAEVPGLPSGFPELDKSIQGFQRGRLYVVGAPKKTGKSMLMLNWAKHLAVDQDIPVMWISTEHSQEDEFSRLLSLTSEVREISIGNGTFSDIPVHVERVGHAVEKLSNAPFWFCSLPYFTVGKIRRIARKYARVFGVKILFFDYIKAVPDTANVREWQELGILADALKVLASTEGIPVVTAVQINREGRKEFRDGGDMDTDYYAGSDRIAQFMSVGMVLRKPSKKENPDDKSFRVLEVKDNRHGPENYSMMLSFEGEIIRMTELSRV
jgi:replicative DNA helicase